MLKTGHDQEQVAERRQTSHPSRPNLVASSPTRGQLPLPEYEAVIFLLQPPYLPCLASSIPKINNTVQNR
ncbi:hypothetical protein YC2023_075015 [Brassica napus]